MSITYSEACLDPHLFGDWFAGETWATWRVLDKALFGEALGAREASIFAEITGRKESPHEPVQEAWLICGRRSGKDVKAASICAYLATYGDIRFNFRRYLTPGERGVIQLLAVDRDQAKVCLGYLKAFFAKPMLAQEVAKINAESVELKNGLAIEIATNDQRRVRGRTVLAVVLDEVAFFRSENSVNPDTEVYAALKPAMATIPVSMVIGISSPYARRGLLWSKYRKHYGKDGDRTLVVQAPTWVMNPNVPRDGEFLTEAFEDDPASAAAEFGAQFRTDVEAFIAREAVDAVVTSGLYERPPVSGTEYVGFVDPSGGGRDSFTLAIGHKEGKVAILDAVRERKPPFSPEAVVAEYAALLKTYRISKITGDKYAGEWPREAFRKHGITYEANAAPKSDLYRDLLPLINSGEADLLDLPALVTQLVGLERKTSRAGRDSIDHSPNGGKDDVANAVAGCLTGIATRRQNTVTIQPLRI